VLPFTHEEFLAVFSAYNRDTWLAQAVAYLAAIAVCWQFARPSGSRDRMAPAVLAAMWAWTGAVYHAMYFVRINTAALVFAAAFLAQAAILGFTAWRRPLVNQPRTRAHAVLGWTLILYAAIIYPAIGLIAGPGYPAMPVFGITPCPLVLFTFGVLLLSSGVRWWLLVIPAMWSLVGGSAAVLLGVPQDWPLLFSALCTPLLLGAQRRAR
jgi:hypothetical protein